MTKEKGIEWFRSLPQDTRNLIAEEMIEYLYSTGGILWDSGDENSPPCLYWDADGDRLDDVEVEVKKKTYFLQNANSGLYCSIPFFWSKNGGYEPYISEAKEFERGEVVKIIRSTKGTHNWRVYDSLSVNQSARRVVDLQDLNEVTSELLKEEQCDTQ